LAVHGAADRGLQEAHRPPDVYVDGGVELDEVEPAAQRVAARRQPVAGLVDRAHLVVVDEPHGALAESLARAPGVVDPLRDVLVCRAVWVVGMVDEATLPA